jgi:hypothetical protein
MKKDEKITTVYTVEITVYGESDTPKLFDRVAKERIKEFCLETISVGIHGFVNIYKTKTKIIKVETK